MGTVSLGWGHPTRGSGSTALVACSSIPSRPRREGLTLSHASGRGCLSGLHLAAVDVELVPRGGAARDRSASCRTALDRDHPVPSSLVRSGRLLDEAGRGRRSAPRDRSEGVSVESVVVGEEGLELVEKGSAKVGQALNARLRGGASRGRDKPVVLDPIAAVLALLRLDDAHQPGGATTPGDTASSSRTMTSSGSPSSPRVPGMKPKSYGKTMPVGRTFFRRNTPHSGSKSTLLREPFGTSTTATRSPWLSQVGRSPRSVGSLDVIIVVPSLSRSHSVRPAIAKALSVGVNCTDDMKASIKPGTRRRLHPLQDCHGHGHQ